MADLICIDRKLIVERDDRQRGRERDDDAAPPAEIGRQGFVVPRFTNAQVLDERDALIATIRGAAASGVAS